MKLLPYYIGSQANGKLIELEVDVLPESWLDIIQLTLVQCPDKDLLLEPLEWGWEAEETYTGLAVCGIETVWNLIPRNLAAGMSFVKKPINGSDPYFLVEHGYTLISVSAINAMGIHPLHIDNFVASRFRVVYGTSAISALVAPLPTEADGYAINPYGSQGALSAVPDPVHQYYGDHISEVAFYFHEELRYWEVVNIHWANPFSGAPEGHMFVEGCVGHIDGDVLWFDTLNGYPSWGYSFRDFPGNEVCFQLGLHKEYRLEWGGLEFSMYAYADAHGIPRETIGGGSRPPVIYFPPLYGMLGKGEVSLALARLFLGRR